MKKQATRFLLLFCCVGAISWLTGCEHTFRGMKQDIREDTDSSYDTDRPRKVTVIKKTETTYPSSSQALPSSPPPLETPPQ